MDKQEVPVPVADKTEGNSGKQSFGLPKKWVYVLVAVVLLGVALLIGFILGNRTATAPEVSTKAAKQDKMVPPAEPKDQKPEATFSCASGKTAFQDKDFGARFCYPASWGTASLADAKVAPSDTGNRQQISFAANPLVSVGGVSEDWSTTVGRGVGCLEPQKDAPPLSSYNTEWHNMSGSGMAVDFAERSLPSKKGGYSITETVSSMLVEGVCVHGYKQVNGSRYKVVSAAFYRSFPEASGITTPSAHMAEPNILFSTEQRDDFDALLASLEAY
jgi:hypothetical protein